MDRGLFRVRVLDWNVLCQALTKGFDQVKFENLEWFHRKQLFEQMFNQTDENGDLEWDFICLQEVDRH